MLFSGSKTLFSEQVDFYHSNFFFLQQYPSSLCLHTRHRYDKIRSANHLVFYASWLDPQKEPRLSDHGKNQRIIPERRP